jgi:hypothetical protein
MSHKNGPSVEALKNESARQRWELFHRAIAHAKQSNTNAMQEADRKRLDGGAADEAGEKAERAEPQLSIAR